MAGANSSIDKIKEEALNEAKKQASRGNFFECEFYVTQNTLDATDYVKKYLAAHDEKVCFIACGGDGTIAEVCTGCMGYDNAYMSVYPCGSGNDYVRYFGGKKPFLDISGIFEGSVRDVDVMKVGDRYSINICNFGFDTAVVRTMEKVKRKPIIGGNNSYYTGIVKALFTARKNHCKIYADGELLNPDGKFLLCTLGNGSYVGGGFNCSPKSDNTDGLMEVALFPPLNILRFVKLISYYSDGTFLDNPKFEKILTYRRAREVVLESENGIDISLDGELINLPRATIQNLQKSIHFIVPRDAIIAPAKHPALVK